LACSSSSVRSVSSSVRSVPSSVRSVRSTGWPGRSSDVRHWRRAR